MENQVMITISREFGSNGREIGRRLAEYLDIGYYNKQIMKKISQDLGVSDDFFSEENQNDAGFFQLSRRSSGLSNMAELAINSQIYERSAELIQKIADMESAVIIGRCADFILKDHPNCIRVFCYCDPNERIRWAIDEYGVSERRANRFVEAQDQKRAGFYEFYTNQKWGDSSNYDVMINTSKMKVEEIVEMLAALYDKKRGFTSFKGAFEDQYIEQKNNEI